MRGKQPRILEQIKRRTGFTSVRPRSNLAGALGEVRRAAVKLQRWYISMHENCSRHACARSGVTPRYSLIRCKLPKTSHDERSDIRVGLKLKSEILKASRDRSFSPGHAAVLLYAHYIIVLNHRQMRAISSPGAIDVVSIGKIAAL